MYNQELFILHKTYQTLTFSRRHRKKETYDLHLKENHFVVLKMLYFLIIVLFTRKRKILVLHYSTLNMEQYHFKKRSGYLLQSKSW